MSETGVALVGAGYISYLHVLGMRAIPELRLRAIASRTRAAAEHRGRIFDAQPYGFEELPAMLARDDIAIAIVAGPNALHFEHAMAAIRAGKHVVIEKPLVLTLDEADTLAEAAAAARVGIGYAENLAFAPLVVQAREVIDSGVIGAIRRAHCEFKHGGPAATGWFRSAALAGGGAHIDLGCHALEILLHVLGHPAVTRIAESVMRIDPASGLDLTARCVHETANGVEIVTDASWIEAAPRIHAVIEGDCGRLVLAMATRELILERSDAPPEKIAVPWAHDFTIAGDVMRQGYAAQLVHFAGAFVRGEAPREGIAEGTNVLRLLLAAYASAATNGSFETAAVPRNLSPIATWSSLRT